MRIAELETRVEGIELLLAQCTKAPDLPEEHPPAPIPSPNGRQRERCVLCRRERANQTDWYLNAEFDDAQAAAAGLDDLCWEQGEDDCLSFVAERGGPSDYLAAMTTLDSLLRALRGEVESRRAIARSMNSDPHWAHRTSPAADAINAWADRLQAIANQHEQGKERS